MLSMQKIPTNGCNRLQSLGLKRLKPFAVNFYKYAGKPCYPAQHCICATKSDLHGSVGQLRRILLPWPGRFMGNLGPGIFSGRVFLHPEANSTQYRIHPTINITLHLLHRM